MFYSHRTVWNWMIAFAVLAAAVSVLPLAFAAENPPAAATPKRPNIVFIFSDDHAVQAMGAYPSWLQEFIVKQQVTPNLDRLAKEGAVFANSFCGNSICAPSRATVLTGKHSFLNGVTAWQTFDGNQTTFPKLLQQAGYQTAIVGKWHLVSKPTGFDFWRTLPGQGDYYNPNFQTPDGGERHEGYCTDITTDISLNWLAKERDKAKPFMLMLHHKAPHRTWMPALKYLHFLDEATVPEPSSLFDDYAGRTASASRHAMGIAAHMQLIAKRHRLLHAGRTAECIRQRAQIGATYGISGEVGLFDDFRHRAVPQQPAIQDVGEAVAAFGLIHVVRGDEEGQPFGSELMNLFPEVAASLGINAGSRLIEQQQPRLVNQARGQRHPLLPAT
jgi:hypothetical protein